MRRIALLAVHVTVEIELFGRSIHPMGALAHLLDCGPRRVAATTLAGAERILPHPYFDHTPAGVLNWTGPAPSSSILICWRAACYGVRPVGAPARAESASGVRRRRAAFYGQTAAVELLNVTLAGLPATILKS